MCLLAGVVLLLTAPVQLTVQGAESTNQAALPATFTFAGGSLADFIRAVNEQLKVDLEKEATIEEFHQWSVRVPKLAIPIPAGTSWHYVLQAYSNSSQSVDGRMGRWSVNWSGGRASAETKPISIIFVPPAQDPARDAVAVKAFSVVELSQEDRELLKESIQREWDAMAHDPRTSSQPTSPSGQIRSHRNGEILLATGNQSFVDLASALVAAYKERAETSRRLLLRRP